MNISLDNGSNKIAVPQRSIFAIHWKAKLLFQKHEPVLYDSILKGVEFKREPTQWPFAWLREEDLEGPQGFSLHGLDFFGWFSDAVEQFSQMEASEKRDLLRTRLISARNWAQGEEKCLMDIWVSEKDVNTQTVIVARCLRILLLIGQEVEGLGISGTLLRMLFDVSSLSSVSDDALAPTKVELHGVSDDFGPWEKIVPLDRDIHMLLSGEEKSSEALFV